MAVLVIVISDEHERGAQADEHDEREREQRAQLPVVGTKHDCGVLTGGLPDP